MTFSKFLALSIIAAVLMFAGSASAEEKTFEDCKVVKVEKTKITVTAPDGAEHSAEVAKDAKITVDGKDTKLEDLKAGLKIKVTVDKGDSGIVVKKIEGTTK